MDDILVALRLLLATVFLLSATGKLLDRPATTGAALALGVPVPIARLVPVGLPIVEIALAAALWPVATAPWAAAGLCALLMVFTALLCVNLARDRHPDCHCFGAIGAAPISWWTVLRNGGLLVGAAFVALAGARDDADIFAGAPWVDVVAFVGLAALCAAAARGTAMRDRTARHGDADTPPVDGVPPVGGRAPDFVLPDARGRTVSLATLRAPGLPVVLVFGHLGCPSCTSLLPDLQRWHAEHADTVTVAFVLSATPESARAVVEMIDVENLLVQEGRAVTELYGRLPEPTALVVDPDGTIATGPVFGPLAIRELVDRVVGRPVVSHARNDQLQELLGGLPVLSVGSPVPDFRLPSTVGLPVHPADLGSGAIVYVFTERHCAPCRELIDLLVRRPQLWRHCVVVNSGWMPPLLPTELSCPALHDGLGFLAAVFDVDELPSAVRVDAGVVSSPIAVGVPAILDLLVGASQAVQLDPDEMTDRFVPRPRRAVVTMTGATTVVGDPASGSFQTLDATGALLWSCFDGTESIAAIATAISEELGAPRDVVLRDALSFARQLGRAGVLDGVRAVSTADSEDHGPGAAGVQVSAPDVDGDG